MTKYINFDRYHKLKFSNYSMTLWSTVAIVRTASYIIHLTPPFCLTLILLTWAIWRAPTNASKWRMGFNSAFKGLSVSYNYRNKRPSFLCAVLTDYLSQTKRSTLSVRRRKWVVYVRELQWLDLDHEKKKIHSHVFFCQNMAEGNTHKFSQSSSRMVCRGSRGTAPLILSLSTRWRWMAKVMHGLPYTQWDPGGHWIAGCLVGYRNSLDVSEQKIISCLYRGSKLGPSSSYPIHYRLRSPGASHKQMS